MHYERASTYSINEFEKHLSTQNSPYINHKAPNCCLVGSFIWNDNYKLSYFHATNYVVSSGLSVKLLFIKNGFRAKHSC